MSEVITVGLSDEIRALNRIESALEIHDEARKHLAEDQRIAEQRVIEAFADSGTTNITIDGRKYEVEFKTHVSPASGKSDELVEWIVEHGGEDLVKPAMHHARRDAFIREVVIGDDGEAHIPAGLAGLVQVYEATKLKRRKVS